MDNQKLESFKKLCQQLPYTQNNEQETCENQIEEFIMNTNNFQLLQNFLSVENNYQIILVCLESMNKTFTKLMNTESNRIKNRENKQLIEQLQHLENINLFLQQYYFSIDLNSIPRFIINTSANLIADIIKIFLSNNKLDYIHLKNLFSKVQLNDLQSIFRIFVVIDYLLGNLQINKNSFNYFTYKRMINSFKFQYLPDIFDIVNESFYALFNNHIQFNEQTIEVLKVGVQCYKRVLTYSFQFSYSAYQYELDSEDMSTSIFPKEFGQHFSKLRILEIYHLILTQQIDNDLSYLVCQCLNEMVRSRESILQKEQQQIWKQSFIKIFVTILQNTPQTEKFLSEKIDLIRKISHFFGQKFLIQNYENQQLFEQHIILLAQQIIQISSNRIDSFIFKKLILFIKKLKNFEPSIDQNSNIYKFLQFYFQYFFSASSHTDFLQDQYKTISEFEELIDFRFIDLKEVFDIKSSLQFQLLDQIISNFQQNFQLLDKQNFIIYANQFEHFVIFFTLTLIKFDQISNRIDDSEAEESINHQRAKEENLQNFMQGQSKDVIRNIILSNNYFLKQLTAQVLSNYSFNEGLQELVEKEVHYSTLITRTQQFQKPENYLLFVCNKLLGQIDYQDMIIIQSSLYYLKSILEIVKKKFRAQREQNELINNVCKILVEKSNQFLINKDLIKLRKKVYEIISICYLDDHTDDYIQNSLDITNTIFKNINVDTNNMTNIKKIFYDIQGVYQMCFQTKIIVVFTKISYPKIEKLLEVHGDLIIKDNDLVTILLKFYQKLLEHTSNKYSLSQAHTIMFKIITDACRLVSELLTQVNQALSSMQTFDQRAEFINSNIKLVKNFLRLFQILLKCSDISFSVFHFFGNDMFINFINNIHNFIFLISDSIITYFMDEKKTLLNLMVESVTNLSDFMIEYFTPEQIQQFFFFVQKFYSKNANDSQNDPEKIKKIKSQNESIFQIISTILVAIYEDSQLNKFEEDKIRKNRNLVNFLYPTAQKLIERFLQINLENPETSPELITFSSLLFQFILVFQEQNLLQNLIQSISQHFFFEPKNSSIEEAFINLCKNIDFNMIKHNIENFDQNYKTFQKKLLQLFQNEQNIRKQSNAFIDQVD